MIQQARLTMNEWTDEWMSKKKQKGKLHLWGNSAKKIPNVDILWMVCAWSCSVTLTLSTINLTQRDSIDQSINRSVNQSVIKMYRQFSLHLTDDTNALLHRMKWTSVSVCSSFILNHIIYVSGSMSETLIFNKNKSLCTNVSCLFILELSFHVTRWIWSGIKLLTFSLFEHVIKDVPPKCHLQPLSFYSNLQRSLD